MIVKSADVLTLLPFLAVLGVAVLVLVMDLFHRTAQQRGYLAHVSAVGLVVAFGAVFYVSKQVVPGDAFGGMLYHDGFTLFLDGIFLLAALVTVLLSPRYLQAHGVESGEYYVLVLMATAGMMLMAAAGHLLMLFVALEMMSLAVYVLVGYFRQDGRSAEAAMKYFFLGAFASALFLYGSALVYGVCGSLHFESIAVAIGSSMQAGDGALVLREGMGSATLDPLLYIGVLLLLVGMAFKVALVPFHMWAPDAYSGAPMTVVGFMATGVKAAAFGALIRFLFIALGPEVTRLDGQGWVQLFFYLSLLTMILGNLVALVQDEIKRMLAYASIAHAGYGMVGLVAAGYFGAVGDGAPVLGYAGSSSVLFYLFTYAVATLGVFGVLSYLGYSGRDVRRITDLSGLARSHPGLAAMMGFFLLSSAGIPMTAGFMGKFYVFKMAVVAGTVNQDPAFFVLVVVAVLASMGGAYYYLRVIVCMYMKEATVALEVRRSQPAMVVLALLAGLVLWVGVMPKTLFEWTSEGMRDFQGAVAYPDRRFVPEAYVPQGLNPLVEEGAVPLQVVPKGGSGGVVE